MSIEAIRATVALAREQVNSAHQEVRLARDRLAEAMALLDELSRGHSESLLPPEFAQADEQLEVGLTQLAGSLELMDRFVAGL